MNKLIDSVMTTLAVSMFVSGIALMAASAYAMFFVGQFTYHM